MTLRALANANPAPPPTRSRRNRPKPPCPCCAQPGGFCDAHRARLAAIREDFEERRAAKSHEGLQRRSPKSPQCCRPGCFEPRTSGRTFCDRCEADGYVDGIGE